MSCTMRVVINYSTLPREVELLSLVTLKTQLEKTMSDLIWLNLHQVQGPLGCPSELLFSLNYSLVLGLVLGAG